MTTMAEDVIELIEQTVLKDDDRVTVLKINRPEKANSYNDATIQCLEKEIKKAINDKHTRVIMITGEGNRAFCAGADLNGFASKGFNDALKLKSREVFDLLAASTKLSIALINGAAIGGGLELALACDFRFASPTASFAFPEVAMGLTPAAGGMRRIQPIIGKGRAKEMVLMGRRVSAQEALSTGLITYLGDDFFDHGVKSAMKIANLDQMAVQMAKKNLDFEDDDTARKELEALSQALLYELKRNAK